VIIEKLRNKFRSIEQEPAERGAKLLDRACPDWHRRVYAPEIDVDSTYFCPLGQVYGDYFRGRRELRLSLYPNDPALSADAYYGFLSLHKKRRLNNAWRKAVKKRHKQDVNIGVFPTVKEVKI